MANRKPSLGRPLDELLSDIVKKSTEAQSGHSTTPAASESEAIHTGDRLKQLPVDLVGRGQYQPRKDMTLDALEELASSIRAQGVIQPIVVRSVAGDRYEIIAGERRWRAAQMAGLSEVPAIIKEVPDEAAMAMALIENIQREDLNCIEEAFALQRLIQEFSLTHQQAAETVGKSRTVVTNLLRLLNLRDDVRELVENGDIEMGHARALLAINVGHEQARAAKVIVERGLTVRETEKLVRAILSPLPKKEINKILDPDVVRLQKNLTEKLGAEVNIHHSIKGKGKLIIQYSSLDELDGILNHIQ